MNVLKIIEFIGEKNPKYEWERIKKYIPSAPLKGYLDDNGRQGVWVEKETIEDADEEEYGEYEVIKLVTYKDDKKNGICKIFNSEYDMENDNYLEKGTYIDNKKNGIWEFYDDGQLKKRGDYTNDVKDGLWEYFYGNGQVYIKGNYKNGVRDGVWEYYEKDGRLYSKQLHKSTHITSLPLN